MEPYKNPVTVSVPGIPRDTGGIPGDTHSSTETKGCLIAATPDRSGEETVGPRRRDQADKCPL